MRIGRVDIAGRVRPAVHHDGHWVAATALGAAGQDAAVVELLGRVPALQAALADADLPALVRRGEAVTEDAARLHSPLDRPRAIVAVGLNYREHAEEVAWQAPSTPLLFAKWPSALTGPFDPVALDERISSQVDHEVELAAVIGRPTLDVTAEEALSHVGGYLVANDVSARDIQSTESQWTRAKSFDGFCPLGPWVTTADAVPDPQDLRIRCAVNGEVRQDASTAQMIHGVAQLIAFASRATTLQPGDLLLTGTPSGVAMGSPEPRWLRPGDVVRCEIDGLGALENPVVARCAPS